MNSDETPNTNAGVLHVNTITPSALIKIVDPVASGGVHVDSIVDLQDDDIHMTAAGECKRKNEDRPLLVTKIQGLNHHIEVIPGQSNTDNN
ncbi:hypothetical protein PR048_022766 [Dryococelus australis]|uniref:Uncharacterized protein n=1 Tax=Dryococelus australis TaxID=614101 RepID=A0ABQ9GS51_9NEOP|nr:hypothetical protein PR048_022766 [Dryococelus australis]